jgi:ATP-binding cassette subfamily B protein
MVLKKKKYKSIDTLRFGFEVSPVCTVLYAILPVTQSIMQTAITALATANFVDTATSILNNMRPYQDIYAALAVVLLTLGLVNTIGAVAKLVLSKVNVELQRSLKPAIVKIFAALNYMHIENDKSWELITRVSRDPVKAITDGISAFIQFVQIIISIVSVFVLIVSQVWWAALIICLFSVPMFFLSMRAGKKNYQAERDAEKFNRRTEYLGEVLTGRENVDERTLFAYNDEINCVWQEQYEAGRKLQVKVTAKNFLISKSSSIILALISLLVALTLIGPVVNGQMSAGMFMGIVSAVFGMIQKLGFQMSRSLENISRAGEYMRDFSEFIALSEAEDALAEPDDTPIQIDSLEFCNVRFCYPGSSKYILDGLSFKLEAGHHYAFVGKNGAGKTTITKLLTGLYTEYEGEILVNGKELRKYPVSTIKAMFSVVYQDFSKYYIEMRENIALGDVHSKGKEVEAAHRAGLDEVISKLAKGIDTPLGKILKDGQDISGGQWQRVAIARTLVSRAPIRIFDEPTSALDPISESNLYRDFEKLMKGKTTVFVSHRLGSTKLADEILVIDEGKMIERGTHEELLTRNGQYAQMFEAQREWYR